MTQGACAAFNSWYWRSQLSAVLQQCCSYSCLHHRCINTVSHQLCIHFTQSSICSLTASYAIMTEHFQLTDHTAGSSFDKTFDHTRDPFFPGSFVDLIEDSGPQGWHHQPLLQVTSRQSTWSQSKLLSRQAFQRHTEVYHHCCKTLISEFVVYMEVNNM